MGVATSYMLDRLVAKPTTHVINCGKSFAALPVKYSLTADPNSTIKLDGKSIAAIQNSMVNNGVTPATALQSILEALDKKQPKPECYVQHKAMLEIRLAFFGMVLPALGLSVTYNSAYQLRT
ncbi:unnamed protein product [Haemonchus placei]|uniref:Sideroflexin-4 n=1 Tax=Haemonchus placei TaxID=6290 RepID=A0A0N4WTL4_HAEPC|nr:unnamed protein product [Haemonchus placei]